MNDYWQNLVLLLQNNQIKIKSRNSVVKRKKNQRSILSRNFTIGFFPIRYNQPVANQSAKKQNSEYRIFFLYIENRVSFDYWQSKAGRFFWGGLIQFTFIIMKHIQTHWMGRGTRILNILFFCIQTNRTERP